MKCRLCDKIMKGRENRHKGRCNGCNLKVRRHRLKLAGVKYLGGKCVECGFSGNYNCFDFHHKGDLPKEHEIGKIIGIKSWETLRKELDKCELLCANCHRLEHTKIDSLFDREVQNYAGVLLDF